MATGKPYLGEEFISGIYDRKTRSNQSYNVCRFHVSEKEFEEERKQGFHLRAVKVPFSTCCPARVQPLPHADVLLTDQRAEKLRGQPGEIVELVHQESGPTGEARPVPCLLKMEPPPKADDGKLTICRLGVPRRRMAEEVFLGLHSGYKVVRVAPAGTPDRFKKAYVQAKGNDTTHDNVDRVGRPWDCGARCPVSPVTGT